MDDKLNVEESGLGINIEPKEEGVIHTPVVEEEGRIDEFPELLEEDDDLNKKTYYKISPTLYIKKVLLEEGKEEELDEEGNVIELFKILNPETGVVEERALTDEEKHEVLVLDLKQSKIRFRNTVHDGNVTKTKFDANYKQKRKRRNALAKKSRKANR